MNLGTRIPRNTREVAPGPGEAKCQAVLDWRVDFSDDRNCFRRGQDRLSHSRRSDHNHVRIEAHHIGGDLGKALRSAKSRAPLDDEVRAFNVAEPAQLSRERPKAWTGRFRNLRDWAHRED